ncbi:hypothetical protein AWC38_SpisGene20130 [Stylophora pistillata]|uniref:Uncharacterized protein n=1 Tax=Stylophora pistillata TaxID=50429 RepID=A0A2B4RGZ0_STYPI|nr:hypothetical protein AWC38_SpisGene20130 [Stylophora pistillata]
MSRSPETQGKSCALALSKMDHNDGSEEDNEADDPGEGEISEDYANKMHIELNFEMDDTVDYQDDTDAKSGPDNMVDDGDDMDMTADIAKGLHMVAKRTERSLNCKMKSAKA